MSFKVSDAPMYSFFSGGKKFNKVFIGGELVLAPPTIVIHPIGGR